MKLSDCLDALLPDQNNNKRVLFKHVGNRDIAFKIDSFSKDNNVWEFSVTWYNVVNSDKVFPIDQDVIQIKTSDLQKWESIDVQAGRILRDNL